MKFYIIDIGLNVVVYKYLSFTNRGEIGFYAGMSTAKLMPLKKARNIIRRFNSLYNPQFSHRHEKQNLQIRFYRG